MNYLLREWGQRGRRYYSDGYKVDLVTSVAGIKMRPYCRRGDEGVRFIVMIGIR